jgi:hypothetical protein
MQMAYGTGFADTSRNTTGILLPALASQVKEMV